MNSRLQYTKHSRANNTLEKFHALLIMATFYGRHVLGGCAKFRTVNTDVENINSAERHERVKMERKIGVLVFMNT